MYIFIFLFTRFPGLLNRLYNWISNDDVYYLFLLQALFSPLQGFFNAWVYGIRLFSFSFFQKRNFNYQNFLDKDLEMNIKNYWDVVYLNQKRI